MRSISPQAPRELCIVLVITGLGVAIRFSSFGRLGLSHFDDYINDISGLCAERPEEVRALNPTIIPYAPPGFPILVGLARLLIGVSDSAAILASLMCAVLTNPVAS